jgi:hypothetical protein
MGPLAVPALPGRAKVSGEGGSAMTILDLIESTIDVQSAYLADRKFDAASKLNDVLALLINIYKDEQ